MRQILFKAKLKNKNKWVEGFYCSKRDTTYCFTEDYKRHPVETYHYIVQDQMTDWGLPNELRLYEIDPSTLCQFTGLTDKTGKKIWENDIVLTQEFYDKPYAKNRKSKNHIGVVEYKIYGGNGFYNPETGNHDKRKEYEAKWIVKVKDYGKFVHSSWGDFYDCEVLGNIFDNPELLEERDNK